MPNTYGVDNDGIILNTRYSDLVRCTEKGVLTVVKELLFGKKRYQGGITEFGSLRHEMFYKESIKTGRIPKCFMDALGINWKVSKCEEQMNHTIFPCVELWSTLDAYCPSEKRIIDYKTASMDIAKIKDPKYVESVKHKTELYYKRSRQHLCYALQLMMSGEIPKHATYLVEYWNEDRWKNKQLVCVDYQRIDVEISLKDIVDFKNNWLKERCERLLVARDVFMDDSKIITK